MGKFDFGGYATRNDLLCGDGVTIRKDAFKHNDGKQVPLLWMHDHGSPDAVLGHAVLENREDGVYAYGKFNDEPQGKHAKNLVKNGDVSCLSIWANQLKKLGSDVIHGDIKELSLVLAGKNPGAFIDMVMAHGDDADEEMHASWDENALVIYHSDDEDDEESEEGGKTYKEVYEAMSPEQKATCEFLVGLAREEATGKTDAKDEAKHDDMDGDEDGEEDEETIEHDDINEGGNEIMHSNVFDKQSQSMKKQTVLSHADQIEIIKLAKESHVGTLKNAIKMYVKDNEHLAHAFVDDKGEVATEQLFPEYELLKKGAPETLERDLTWVDHVLNGIHKSPITRIRTRHADARAAERRAKGYNNRAEEKKLNGDIMLISRTHDPQTVYVKEKMHRDDIIDIEDFDVVAYMWERMNNNMREELALAALIGDGREPADPDKIKEDHIRPIWLDDELYTIHAELDIEGMKNELQGTNTGANFGINYITAEAIVTRALYAREKYKGSGHLEFYCTPHLVNVMLLSKDLNGRRIYNSVSDVAAALNVSAIHTVEQFENKVRTDKETNKQYKLWGLFANLNDYQFGCAKGGQITKFTDFNIDFNTFTYLMETRLSGALIKLWSAIALEELVEEEEVEDPEAQG